MAVDRDALVEPEGTSDDLLARAAGALREITDSGWLLARDSVLERIRRTVRPAPHVTGHHAHGRFTLATPVLVDRLRRAVERSTHVRVLAVLADTGTGTGTELTGVALRLSVPYGESILDAAAATRAAVVAEVRTTLGTPFGPEQVTVDLHVADVHRR